MRREPGGSVVASPSANRAIWVCIPPEPCTSAMEYIRVRIALSQEELEIPVWQQVTNNGALSLNEVEISDVEGINDLNAGDVPPNFSDEENEYSDEEEEEESPRHDLNLRDYQKELVEPVLNGRNSIICAPTGSGKTKVGICAMLEHLNTTPNAKIAFFTRTVPLCKQQYRQIKDHLPPSTNVLLVTGESQVSMSLHRLLPDISVVVLTPMILVNHLRGQRPLLREGITAFTMLVFDECHHTREGECYNNIMYFYFKEKNRSPQGRLPQIVGLTASIGVERATNLDDAKQNILKVCGNLDVDNLTIVKRNTEELQRRVPTPEESSRRLEEVEHDEAIEKILSIMAMLEDRARYFCLEVNDASLSNTMSCLPPNKKLPEYCQWVVSLRKEAREVDIRDRRRETFMAVRGINIITEYLQAYHFALESLDLVHIDDIMGFLDHRFANFTANEQRAHQEELFFNYFTDLQEVVSRRHAIINPNLEILVEVLREHLVSRGPTTRAIVFVRTRMIADALVSWLDRCGQNDLVGLNSKMFTGTNASEESGGMTEAQQQAVVELFRTGEARVLVATSVAEEGLDIPECNLIIKYNHIGNEVTKVQTRGRSRAFDGVSILLGLPHILQREEMNRIRAGLMREATVEISEMEQAQFRQWVEQYQANLFLRWDQEEEEEELRRRNMRSVPFRVICHLCRRVTVQSSDIKTIYEKYRVSTDRNLLNQIKIRPVEEMSMDQLQFVGKAVCLGETEPGKLCGNVLGFVIKHESCPFVTLGIKNIVFQCDNERPRTYKQWKKVPYIVEEITPQEMLEYAQAIFMPNDEGPEEEQD